MTSQEQHNRLYHNEGPCTCPPNWPRDIGPTSCRACYDDPKKGGIDIPMDQCTAHQATRLD